MKTSDFLYDLPEALIAQTPAEPRDHSRLMVVGRTGGSAAHRHFYDLPDCLRPGDVLVVNDTRVMPARLIGERAGGGACEVLLLRQLSPVSLGNTGAPWQEAEARRGGFLRRRRV